MGLDEIIGVVLEYLKDAKEHGQEKGYDLLACVRVVGSYLAEAPLACKEKVNGLLGYMLLIQGDDEPRSASSFLEECYEFLLLVSTSSEDGAHTLYTSKALKVLAMQMPTLSDGSHFLEISLRLTLLIFSKAPLDGIINCYTTEVSAIVAPIARQFALKFELLHLLSIILSNFLGHLRTSLSAMPNSNWTTYIRIGISDILQNQVGIYVLALVTFCKFVLTRFVSISAGCVVSMKGSEIHKY